MEREWRFEGQLMNQAAFYKCLLAEARLDEVNMSGSRFETINLSGAAIGSANGLTIQALIDAERKRGSGA